MYYLQMTDIYIMLIVPGCERSGVNLKIWLVEVALSLLIAVV